jgi:hypothetical protein
MKQTCFERNTKDNENVIATTSEAWWKAISYFPGNVISMVMRLLRGLSPLAKTTEGIFR